MNKITIDLNDYYIGFIQLNPYVYKREDAERLLDGINYDPFSEVDPLTGMIEGLVVLLRREGDIFYDEYSSRYKNEVSYHLGETNKFGIKLTYIKPFQEVYPEPGIAAIKEEVEGNPEALEYLLENCDYYISHSKLDRSDAIVIMDDERMLQVRDEYYDKFFAQPYREKEEKEKEKQKKKDTSKNQNSNNNNKKI